MAARRCSPTPNTNGRPTASSPITRRRVWMWTTSEVVLVEREVWRGGRRLMDYAALSKDEARSGNMRRGPCARILRADDGRPALDTSRIGRTTNMGYAV